MTLSELMDRHAGETVTICGTGPSLDALDLDALAGPRILIHRAAFVVPVSPAETYWLVLDDCWGMGTPGPWHELLGRVIAGVAGMVLVARDPLGNAKRPVAPPRGGNIVAFDGSRPQNVRALERTRKQLAASRDLWTWAGSAGTAVHLAWFMGASRVVLAGCDGGHGHARRLDAYYGEARKDGFGYRPAHDCMMRALEALHIDYTFLGEDGA
jgi:hypothetical protein